MYWRGKAHRRPLHSNGREETQISKHYGHLVSPKTEGRTFKHTGRQQRHLIIYPISSGKNYSVALLSYSRDRTEYVKNSHREKGYIVSLVTKGTGDTETG
jgi:hypothetical protein